MKLILTALLFAITVGVYSQDCDELLPFNEGSTWTIQSYDKKDKPDSKVKQTVKSAENTAEGKSISVEQIIYDDKEEQVLTSDYTMTCTGGTFFISMESMMNQMDQEYGEGINVEVDASDLEFPSDLTVGSSLKDAHMTMKMTMGEGGVSMMKTEVDVTNRKVLNKETITTPAGTFECYKISYDTKAKMIVKVEASGIDWYCPGVGVVKSESYNKKGKLTGWQEMIAFQL